MVSDRTQRNIRRVAELIAKADALLITAGAGMGVDSGLPDFRGGKGFWGAYPALGKLGISFEEMAQPRWFDDRPEMAWAFYGHRQQLYRETKPHDGFRTLLEWGRAMPAGYFVVTSNVDGQFEAADFPEDRTFEQHGNIHRYQCTTPCGGAIWLDDPPDLKIDLETITARGRLPRCPECGALARPNVLMFADGAWVAKVKHEQEQRYRAWLASVRDRKLVILELGAGTAIATIRWHGEKLAGERPQTTLVRVNPDAVDAEEPVIAVRLGALEALRQIEEQLPEGFRERCRAGGSVPRLVRTEKSREAGAAPLSLLPRALDVADLPGDSRSGTAESWTTASAEPPEFAPSTEKIHLHLGALTRVDLGRGLVGLDDLGTISFADESACMQSYIDAQKAWVPMPEVNGLSAPGYTMTARIFHTPEYDAGGTPGIAIVFVQAPDGGAVITLGMARRASDSPILWQLLYETAITTLAPLDHPRVPWVARRPDVDPMQHAQVMPYLNEFERSIAWGWLKLAAFIDATKSKGGRS